MRDIELEARCSRTRLGGDPLPEDLRILFEHRDALWKSTGIELNGDPDWAPWRDTGYLTEADWADPEIAANVKAIHSVCDAIAFFAAHEDGEYFGYWRGPEGPAIADSPLATLDHEGQFRFCGGGNFGVALLFRKLGEERFCELRDWLQSIGITDPVRSVDDFADPSGVSSPGALHRELYAGILGGRA